MSLDPTPFCSRRRVPRHSGSLAFRAKADARAERLSAHNPLFENGFRVTGRARSKPNSRLQTTLQRGLRDPLWCATTGRKSINSRTIEIAIGGVSPLRLIDSTAAQLSESHEAIYGCVTVSTGLFV
jgi:hypothetical protein